MSEISEQANRRVSGPVLTPGFFVDLAHSGRVSVMEAVVGAVERKGKGVKEG